MTELAGIRTIVGTRPADAIFSADGQSVFALDGTTVTAYAVATGAASAAWAIGTRPGALSATRDGLTLVAIEGDVRTDYSLQGNKTQTISTYAIDLASGTTRTYTSTFPYTSYGSSSSFVFQLDESTPLGNGKVLVTTDGGIGTGSAGGGSRILDLVSGTFTVGPTAGSENIAVTSANGMRTVLAGRYRFGTVISVLDADDAVLASKTGLTGELAAVTGAGSAIALYSRSSSQGYANGLQIYDLALNPKVDLNALHNEWFGNLAGLAFSPNGASLYVLDAATDTIYTLSTLDYSVTRAIMLGHPVSPAVNNDSRAYGDALQISSDGRYLSVISDDGVQLVELAAAANTLTIQYGGADADDLTATAARSTVYGEGGNDVLRDGGVAATLYGGTGNDIFYVTNAGTTIGTRNTANDASFEGQDTVRTTLPTFRNTTGVTRVEYIGNGATTLYASPEAGRQLSVFNETLVGGAGDDTIYGTRLDNVVGGAGNDTLYGRDVTGGAGDDYMVSLYSPVNLGPAVNAGTAIIDASLHTSTILFNGRYDFTIISHDGTDRVIDFTSLRFAEQTLRTWHLYDINQLYVTYGGRAASNDELVYWTDRIDTAGRTLADVRTAILDDQLGQANTRATVTSLYQQYGGRAPIGSEQAVWASAIRSGATFDTVRVAILDDPLGHAQTAQTANAFFGAAFGRAAAPTETTAWDALLHAGYDASGAGVATMYQLYGGRLPTATETTAWQGEFARGSTILTVRDSILGDPLAAAGISSIYREYAGRSAQADETAVWLGALRGGATLATVRNTVLDDPIGRSHTASALTDLYREYGGRAPTATEIGSWDTQLHLGATFETARRAIIADPLGQGYASTAISALYRDYGGRPASSAEITAWKGQLQAGATYAAIRTAILDDPLGQTHTATTMTALYQQYFGRAPSSDEIGVWKGLIRAGADFDRATDALMSDPGSIGHVQRATGTPGADTFTYTGSFGNVAISGFTPGQDRINLRGSTFAGADPLDAAHARQVLGFDGATDVLLTFDATDHILLHNVLLSRLSAADVLI